MNEFKQIRNDLEEFINTKINEMSIRIEPSLRDTLVNLLQQSYQVTERRLNQVNKLLRNLEVLVLVMLMNFV